MTGVDYGRLICRLLFDSGNVMRIEQPDDKTADEFRTLIERMNREIAQECPDDLPPLIEWEAGA